MLENFGESFLLVKPTILYRLRAMPERICEIHHSNGWRTVGNGPAYLQWSPDGKTVNWLFCDVSLPDNRRRYKGLKALDHNGEPKRDVVRIAHLPIEAEKEFRKRTIETFQSLHKALESRRLNEAKLLLLVLDSSIRFAVEANIILQPIRLAIQSESESSVEWRMDQLTRYVKAARRLVEDESNAGTAKRFLGSVHDKFRKTVVRLAIELGRVPFRKELQKALGKSSVYINKLCKQNKCEWIPAGIRGEDILPDRAYEKG